MDDLIIRPKRNGTHAYDDHVLTLFTRVCKRESFRKSRAANQALVEWMEARGYWEPYPEP